MSRRTFTAASIATVLGGTAVLATPMSRAIAATLGGRGDLASLGLPTLDITVSSSSFQGAPTELKAGRYLVTVTAEDVDDGAVGFVSPGPGSTVDDLLMVMGGAMPEGSPAAAEASPAAEGEGGGEEMGAPPTFVYQAHFAGGATAMPGMPAQVVIDLAAGDWILWGDDPGAPPAPVTFTVTGDMPAELPEPAADINVTFIDFGIAVEGSLTAGDHILHIENQGAQPHFLFLAKGPDTMTNDDIATILEAEMSGQMTPEALPFNPTDLMPVLASGTQSIGTVTWVHASLEAGTYAALCFFPTAGEGLPHAYHGMHTVFTVS
jgi:hypothetical protein